MIFLISIILGLLPSFAWLLFFLQEDRRQPEPRELIIYTFIAGAAVTFLVLQMQIFFNIFGPKIGVQTLSPIALFSMAAIEEVFKFGAVYFVIKGRKEFDEPIDAMIYLIVAALGFVGATLLHALSSGLVGYYWARSIIARSGYFAAIAAGLFWATLLHSIFNYLIIKFEPLSLATVFLIFMAVIVLVDFEKLKKLQA